MYPGLCSNKPDGTRDIYMFECAPDGSGSTIYRSGFGVDMETARTRVVVPDPSRLETVKRLEKGESFEMAIKIDRNSEPRRVRFTHV